MAKTMVKSKAKSKAKSKKAKKVNKINKVNKSNEKENSSTAYSPEILKAAWRNIIPEITEKLSQNDDNLQKIHTPFNLCYEIIEKLNTYTQFQGLQFAVFNLEFIEVLHYDFDVPVKAMH